MSLVTIEQKDNVHLLRLANGVTNPINPALAAELDAALTVVEERGAGLVLAGNAKFFSLGFDLPFLLTLERREMADFFDVFNAVVLKLYALPMPTICAMAGHAVAGGCILSLACDYRFGGQGKPKMGLNEVLLGVPVPYLADLMLRQIAGDRVATVMGYEGAFVDMTQAQAWGVVDHTCPAATVEGEALSKLQALAKHPRQALAAVKSSRVDGVVAHYRSLHAEKRDLFLACWFSEPTRTLLAEAARKF